MVLPQYLVTDLRAVTQKISYVAQVDKVIVVPQNQVVWTGSAKGFLVNPSLGSNLRANTPGSGLLFEGLMDRDISVDEYGEGPSLGL